MSTTKLPAVRYRNLIFDSARWSSIELRPGDIVISTPPKCGTTWTQMLCALLVFDGPDLPAPLEQLSPWIDMLNKPITEVRGALDAQDHSRILKTHTPLDGIPLHDDVHYVVVGRDPRDVAVSWEHHMANLDLDRFLELRSAVVDAHDDWVPPLPTIAEDPVARFRQFLTCDDGTLTLTEVLQHLAVAWQHRQLANVHLVHYRDLRHDAPRELLRLARALGFPLTPERARELSAEADLERMRERADGIVPSASQGLWHDNRRFIRSGGQGEWRAWMTPEDEQRYWQRIASLVDSDLARWLHEGRG